MKRPLVIAVLTLFGPASLLGIASCTGDDETAGTTAAPTTTSGDAVPSSLTGPLPSSTLPFADDETFDYDGQRFEFGRIVVVQRLGPRVLVRLVRQELVTDDGPRSGKQLTSEPVVHGEIEIADEGDPSEPLTFALDEAVEVLRLADPVPCTPDDGPPVWAAVGPADLVSGVWMDRDAVSLTFGDDGMVSRVRLSAAC